VRCRGESEGCRSTPSQVRHRVCGRAGAREWLETVVAGSCGVLVSRRGTKQQLGRGESFDDMHGSAADRAVPERVRMVGCRRWGRSGDLCCSLEQAEAEWQEGGALPVGEEAEVADAHEAARQQVKQEAAQELFDG
jgi:hypothetical protein